MKDLKKGFTLIELLVVIAIIGILATTVAPKIFLGLRKAIVAKVQHNLGVIRSRIALEEIAEQYPDLGNEEGLADNSSLLSRYQVKATPAFTNGSGEKIEESDKVVSIRDNTGGWIYNRELGEIYANLPNGAYTGDSVYEIWDGGNTVVASNSSGENSQGEASSNSWGSVDYELTTPPDWSDYTGAGGAIYEDPDNPGTRVVDVKPNVGWLPNVVPNGVLNGNYYIYVDDTLAYTGFQEPTNDGAALDTESFRQEVQADSSNLKVAFEYTEDGVTKIIYDEIEIGQ